ncbi:MAG: hypothetical protein HFI06_10785 [Eubacterium sp.]|nr:hypothetical protein [Eubacterium sp.]
MKVARHTKILELIDNYDIETQDELAKRLQEAGFTVTQATVSRDIREMRLTKIATAKGKQKYSVSSGTNSEIAERSVRVFKEAVIKMAQMCIKGCLAVIEGKKWPYVADKSVYNHEKWKEAAWAEL